jgi:multiple sugar transport system ATP-binding protein
VAEVQLKEVDKVYEGGVHAVQDLSIDVADGEFLVLVGPSGCGKTTALRMIAGLESITDGTITIGDRIVNQLSPKDRDIAMVFQNYALYPHLSVADNIAFGLRLRKTPRNVVEERIAWAARLLDLTPYLARKPKELSGGQRQRVAMGRAIVREPQVFLMDEPLSNLDAKLRIQMRAEIAKLQHELDTTTIYVTHDQIEAMTMGDRVAVMSMGVLQQVDRPQQLYDAPLSVFVASFIGTPPMNLFRGTVVTDNGTVAVTLGTTSITVEQACVTRYGGIRSLDGRNVVVGVRAEDLYPASTRQDLPTIDARVELVEALGSGVMAHFHVDVDAYRAIEARGAGAADGDGAEDLGSPLGGALAAQPNLVAHFPPRVELRLDDTVPVAIDPGALHFFDEETGAALR